MKLRTIFVTAVTLIALCAFALPVQAQPTNTVTWLAQYYNNLFLSGTTPHFETQVANGLNLDFGTGSPDASINADNFSARFTADAFFNQGTYRFSIRADDEFRLWVNGNVVLSTLDGGQPATVLNVDVPLNGTVHLQVDYRERTGNASISVNWQNANAVTTPIPTGTWLAEYFPNQQLAQPPAAIINESTPSHNWGFSQPLPNMPAEYWSARWRTSQHFDAGTYRFTARADDGVRVYVDNVLIIDRFSESPGAENVVDHAMSTGTHVITVEYLELFNNAFLDFRIEQIGVAPGTPVDPGASTATVRAFRLNVRNAPSTNGTFVVTKIDQGQTYPIIGRTADNSWYQIDVNGTQGWVSGFWVTVNNATAVPPNEEAPTLTIPAGSVATQTFRVNMRNAPGTTGTEVINIIPRFTVVRVVGRIADSTWLQVEYNGEIGWILGSLVTTDTPLDFASIPVTG